MSASTEEMVAQVEEMSASAQSLAELAQVLQAVVMRFKLEEKAQTVEADQYQRSLTPVVLDQPPDLAGRKHRN